MKLSLVLPASLLATACSGAQAPPPSVPIAPMPVTTTNACTASSEGSTPPPINVTVSAPAKVIDPAIVAAAKRLPVPDQTVIIYAPSSLRTIDGKLRLHGKVGASMTEVTLPTITIQCEQAIDGAIQNQRPVELRGKGRVLSDAVPGYGLVIVYDLEDVSTCVAR